MKPYQDVKRICQRQSGFRARIRVARRSRGNGELRGFDLPCAAGVPEISIKSFLHETHVLVHRVSQLSVVVQDEPSSLPPLKQKETWMSLSALGE